MLVIFDVDGTLISGEESDWRSFDEAITAVLGLRLTPPFFEELAEITAQSIAEAAIRLAGKKTGQGLEEKIHDLYLAGLQASHAANPQAFGGRSGAAALLDQLAATPGVTVAIATGDWRKTISFKLASAGLDISRFPLATSSDFLRRSDIIAHAAGKTGRPVSEAIYVGDGVWDLRACRMLGIPFIGTGVRTEILRAAGAVHLHPDFAARPFLDTLRAAATR